MWPTLAHIIGTDDATGPWYLFWSGFGGHIPIAASITIILWRRYTCAAPRCIRIVHAQSEHNYCHHHTPN